MTKCRILPKCRWKNGKIGLMKGFLAPLKAFDTLYFL